MDTEKIQKVCDEYLEARRCDDYFDHPDWRYRIYETVLKAVFGDDISDRLHDLDKQREIRRKKAEIEKLRSEIGED